MRRAGARPEPSARLLTAAHARSALELAMTHRTHVDTVLAYRQRFLQSAGRQEADAKFLQVGREVQVDWDAVQAKKRQEKERELERAGAAGTRATAGK